MMKTYETCEDVREEFSALLDGELDSDEQDGIEHHLSECSDCLRELDGMKRVGDLYSELPVVSTPDDFEISLSDESTSSNVVELQSSHRKTQPLSFRPLLAAAAVLVLLAGVSFVASQQLGGSGQMEMAAETAAIAPEESANAALKQEVAVDDEVTKSDQDPSPAEDLPEARESFADADIAAERTQLAEPEMPESLAAAPAPAAPPVTGGANPPSFPGDAAGGRQRPAVTSLADLGFTRVEDNRWVEEGYTDQELTDIEFGSDAFRTLLQKRPQLVPLLPAAGHVIFKMDDVWYQAKDFPIPQ